jgi:cytochrome P450
MQEAVGVHPADRPLRRFSEMPELGIGGGFRSHNEELRKARLEFCARAGRSPHDFTRLASPFGNVMLALSPRAIEQLLVARAQDFEKSAMMTFTLAPLAGDGLFTSKGELWKRQRKLMAPLFTPAIIDRYAQSMVECAQRVVDSWKDGQRVDLAREMTRLAMSVAGRTLFDADTMEESDEIGAALTIALRWVSEKSGSWFSIAHILARRQLEIVAEKSGGRAHSFFSRAAERLERPLFLPGHEGRELRACIDVLDRRVQKMIDDRRGSPEKREDLLTKLLSAKDDDQKKMSDRQIRDEILTLFVAGHETTASALAWTIAHLAKAPELYARVQREAFAVGRTPALKDLGGVAFSLRAFKEALRLHPPVYLFGRTAQNDTELGGYAIRRFTHCLVSPYATQRRESEWPNADAFDPERFLPELEAKRHKHAFIPFGAGPRICIGNHFALLEAQLVLPVLFSQCDFEVTADVESEPSAALRPRSVPAVVRKRKPN